MDLNDPVIGLPKVVCRSGPRPGVIEPEVIVRILLSEGSGLTSRQVAGRLGKLGHEVEVLSSTGLCLARFTRHVRRIHHVPAFGRAPLAWLEAADTVARERAADLLFPTQEQVTALSAWRSRLSVETVAPPFSSLRRVQDKISAYRTLAEIGISQPPTVVVRSADDLATIDNFPVFVKRPVSTASSGVRRAASEVELGAIMQMFGGGQGGLLVQSQVDGPLAMVQAVADDGRLVAHHANLLIREGIGGGAAIKQSVVLPMFAEQLQKLTRALHWHGPLSMDVIVTPRGPMVIDVNPRIVEPANAQLAGVDLVGAVLDLARKLHPSPQSVGCAGVRSHQLLLAVLRAAEQTNSRLAVLREVHEALGRRGDYAGSVEELTPVAGDPLAIVPLMAAVIATLAWPGAWRAFLSGAVGMYALTPEAWSQILSGAEDGEPSWVGA